MGAIEDLKWAAPSVLTIGALVCGLTAVRLAASNDFSSCVICIFFSALLDGMDGHVARALGTSSDFGFELDSLCDLANFGVAPALVIYFWADGLPQETSSVPSWLVWAACCAYGSCCALRLARFNAQGHAEQMNQQHLHQNDSPDASPPTACDAIYTHNLLRRKLYFQGVPAPIAAMYALFPMTLSLSRLPAMVGAVGEPDAWAVGRRGTTLVLVITAALMVSAYPTFSSKMLKANAKDSHLRSRHAARTVLKAIVLLGLLAVVVKFPFEAFLVLVLMHAVSLPVSAAVFYLLATDQPMPDKRN